MAARVFILLSLLVLTGTAIRLKKSRKTNISVQSKSQTDNSNDASDEPVAALYQAGANAGEEAAGKTAEGGEGAANSAIAGSASLAHIAEDAVEKDAATLTQAAKDAKVTVEHALSMAAEDVKAGANIGEEAAGKIAEGGEGVANSAIAGSASLAHIAEDVAEKDIAATLTQAAEDAKVTVEHALSMAAENVQAQDAVTLPGDKASWCYEKKKGLEFNTWSTGLVDKITKELGALKGGNELRAVRLQVQHEGGTWQEQIYANAAAALEALLPQARAIPAIKDKVVIQKNIFGYWIPAEVPIPAATPPSNMTVSQLDISQMDPQDFRTGNPMAQECIRRNIRSFGSTHRMFIITQPVQLWNILREADDSPDKRMAHEIYGYFARMDINPAHKADLLRFWLILKWGGVWLDSSLILPNGLDFIQEAETRGAEVVLPGLAADTFASWYFTDQDPMVCEYGQKGPNESRPWTAKENAEFKLRCQAQMAALQYTDMAKTSPHIPENWLVAAAQGNRYIESVVGATLRVFQEFAGRYPEQQKGLTKWAELTVHATNTIKFKLVPNQPAVQNGYLFGYWILADVLWRLGFRPEYYIFRLGSVVEALQTSPVCMSDPFKVLLDRNINYLCSSSKVTYSPNLGMESGNRRCADVMHNSEGSRIFLFDSDLRRLLKWADTNDDRRAVVNTPINDLVNPKSTCKDGGKVNPSEVAEVFSQDTVKYSGFSRPKCAEEFKKDCCIRVDDNGANPTCWD